MSAATLQASLIGPDDERWAKALSTMRHDIYHLAAYVSFASRWQESGQPCALHRTCRRHDAVQQLDFFFRERRRFRNGGKPWRHRL